MGVLADACYGFAELIEGGQILRERRFGADLLGGRILGDRPLIDAAGQPVQGRADGAAEDVGGLGVAQCGERPDGVDAEPVQLLLGDRPDAPQPAHRQPVEQHPLLGAGHHPDAVGFGQVRGDLGDLLARSGPDGGDQSRFIEHLRLQRPAERFDVVSRRTREFDGFAEGLVERKLLQDGHKGAHGVEHAAARHAVDDAARR